MRKLFPGLFFLMLFTAIFSGAGYSQKYIFFNYQVEQGLAQSQAYSFCQDSSNRLWIATYGGISRFDGTHFSNLTKADGLINDFTTCIHCDRKNNIWVGTQSGLSKYDGSRFRSFPFMDGTADYISGIDEDGDGTIWVVDNFKLFCIKGDKAIHVMIPGQADTTIGGRATGTITTICADKRGRIWIAVFRKGIFCLEKGKWVQKIDLSHEPMNFVGKKIYFDHSDTDKQDDTDRIWIVHKKGLLFYDGHTLLDRRKEYSLPPGNFVTMETDPFSKVWIITTEGLFRLNGQVYEHFNSGNGFTDNPVTNIFKDKENNFWVSTIGAGIWRYSFDPFTIYDKPIGGKLNAIMSIVEEGGGKNAGKEDAGKKGLMWMGTYGSGLIRYDGHRMQNIRIPSTNSYAQQILCLFPGVEGDLWIGTDNGGLWRLAHGKFTRMDKGANGLPAAVNQISEDGRGGLWLSSSLSCLHLSKDGKITKTGIWSVCTLAVGPDSVLAGTEEGLLLIRDGKPAIKLIDDILQSYPIQCMVKKGDFIYLGTQNKGLVVWNRRTGSCDMLNTGSGMNSDIIYSLLFDEEGNLWVGTGKGINKIEIDPVGRRYSIMNYATPGSITSSECNQGAILEDRDKNIWFGTTKGALLYDRRHALTTGIPVRIELQQVKLFSKDIPKGKYSDSLTAWNRIPLHLKLPYPQNHLTFGFRGITFKHANDLFYRYKLEGLEDNFSELSTNSSVVYPALPPGQYTFMVKAYVPGKGYSPNTEQFPFEITGPFYKSKFFPFVSLLALLVLGLWAWLFSNKIRRDRKLRLEKIKQDEYDKIRQRTSEDFHDELGNKITRISVLADILQSKLGHKEDARTAGDARIAEDAKTAEDSKTLILQIKDNIGSLYEGTREILWSLTPENDNLQGIARHVCEFGIELFHESPVKFIFSDQSDNLQTIPMNGEYSRNIIMIFKEAMNNILRHSEAGNAWLEISLMPGRTVSFLLRDDGIGFDQRLLKKGYGIGNMKMRATRIDGSLEIDSIPGSGTRLRLTIKTPPYD